MAKEDRDRSGQSERRSGVSRRAFLSGGAAASLSGALLEEAAASAAPGADTAAGSGPVGPGHVAIVLVVNGTERSLEVEPRVTLLDALRDRLDVTGPKKVCDRATCGACTVLEDGELIYACTRLAVEADGREITTVEGLGTPENLHPVQQAFVELDAQQCGFCTPGFVMATEFLLRQKKPLDDQTLEHALGGNLCRCGTYGNIRRVLEHLDGERS